MASPAAFPSPPYELRQSQANEVVIAVMGATGSGKTTLINTLSGSQMRISGGLRSCTNTVQVAPSFTLDGRVVTLIDTPGFDDTTRSDTEILRLIVHFLTATYTAGTKLSGIIYIHRIPDLRMGGISTRNFRMFRKLCGDDPLKNVIIVTNMWGQVSKDIGEARERELASDDLFFKPVLEKGAQMLRHDESLESAQAIIRQLLDNHPLVLQIQREIVDENRNILQTSAGEELNKELSAEMERHKKEMANLQQEWKDAMDAKDEQTRGEIEAETKKLQREIDRIQTESSQLVSNFQRERADLEQRLSDMDAEAKREQQQMQEQFRAQIEALEKQRQMDADQSRERQEQYARQIAEFQGRKKRRRGLLGRIGHAVDRVLPF